MVSPLNNVGSDHTPAICGKRSDLVKVNELLSQGSNARPSDGAFVWVLLVVCLFFVNSTVCHVCDDAEFCFFALAVLIFWLVWLGCFCSGCFGPVLGFWWLGCLFAGMPWFLGLLGFGGCGVFCMD